MNNWTFPICVVLCLAAFGVAFVVMPSNKSDDPPSVPQPAAPTDKPPDDPGKRAKTEAPKASGKTSQQLVKVDEIDKEPPPAPKPKQPAYRIWRMPEAEKLTGADKGSYDVRELAVSEDGSVVLAKSKLEVNCLNVVVGQMHQTFKPAKPRWDYQKPESKFMRISPDAKCVVVGSESLVVEGKKKIEKKEVAVYNATTGSVLGRSTLDERTDMYRFEDAAVFTPRGDYLLLPTFDLSNGLFIQAISCGSGAVRLVNMGRKYTDHGWELTIAVPQEPTLIVERRGGKTAAFDLRTGTEKTITALTVDPWTLFNRGVHLSPDGSLVLSQGLHALQVCDWRANRLVFETKIGEQLQGYSNGQFTPDGKRVLVQWNPSFKFYKQGLQKVYNHIWLYDIATQKRIAEFTPEAHGFGVEIYGLTISRDGKTLVWGHETKVISMDFKAAFGIDPLPPASPPGPDTLPWK